MKTEIETVEVKKKIAKIVDAYGEASKIMKESEATMKKNRPALIETALDIIDASAKSINLEGAQYKVQVQFKDSMMLDTESPDFKKLEKYVISGKVPAVAIQHAVCVSPDKTAEALEILKAIGREDLIVSTVAYTFMREVYEAQAVATLTGEQANIQNLLNTCVIHKTTPTIKIL